MSWCLFPAVLFLGVAIATDPSPSPDGVTFLKPPTSYVEYRPQWDEIREIGLELSFRTLTNTAVLLHHTLLHVTGEYRPQLIVRLDHGVLVVEHQYGDVSEKILVAKGMSHDRWHTVKTALSLDKKELRARVDDRPEKTHGLKAFVETRVGEAYQPGARTSVVFLGGFSPESLMQPGTFVGCFKDLHIYNGDTEIKTEVHGQADVEPGCRNACSAEDPCQNNGKCVNLYTEVECDCFRTGFHGDQCEIEGQTTVTLTGAEWIRYNVYEDHESERNHLPGIRIAMDFRTGKSEGVLFYASETTPQYNHLAVSLHNGTLHVSVVFEDRETHSELYTTIGKQIDDGRWHSLTVIHEGKDVKIQLDNDLEDMDAKHSHPHLNMPEMVYFAGVDEGNLGIGLRSEEPFIGCLRGLYYNHIAILDHLDDRTYVHSDVPLEDKCQDVHTTSMQFQHDRSYTRILNERKDNLDLEFEFRTYKPDQLLFHVDVETYDYKGYIKGFLVTGKLEVHIVPSSFTPETRQIITVGKQLHRAQWHNVKVFYRKGVTQVWVNKQYKVEPTEWEITIGEVTYFGFAPDILDEKKSYIGCMKHIILQGAAVDPLPLIESENSVGVSMGSCDLTDWCKGANRCLNRGICVSEWFSAYCDCSNTLYEGRHCQFSQLRRSCEEHYLNGVRTSGVQHIDLDGVGPFKPAYVYCNMGVLINGRKYGVTKIDHNLYPQTKVRSPGLVDMKKLPAYRGLSVPMMKSLVKESAFCRQHMAINCFRTFLGLGKQTYFTSIHNVTFAMVGGNEEDACQCYTENTCIDNRFKCNCDQRSGRWVSDSGYIQEKEMVPVSELTFLQEYGGQANITLGALECGGKVAQTEETVVMFTSEHAFLDMEGWQGGNLELAFRTLKSPAVLLYQHGQNNTVHHTQLVAELVNDHLIIISASQPPLHIELNTSLNLASGEWQYLNLEVSHNEMKASVGGVRQLVKMPDGGLVPGMYATRLYVGGKPILYPNDTPGLVGCIGGLILNEVIQPLVKLALRREDIVAGCKPMCESDPCHNGATCHELWENYQCSCANVHAHLGENCERNINTNSIKFTKPESQLYFEDTFDILGEEYVFSFRSVQKRALLLYIFDHNNNFVQADIEEGEIFHWSYNSGYKIEHIRVKVKGLTDGLWKQVAVLSEQDRIIVDVEGTVQRTEDKRMPLLTYTQVPFQGSVETVVPFRNLNPLEPGVRVYIGGVSYPFISIEGLKGCMRGLKIGDEVLDLAGAGEGKEGLTAGCPSGCETAPCKNEGRCFDDVDFNDAYTCDCTGTGEAGENCDEEVGLYFKGTSQLEEFLRKPADGGTGGETDRLELVFATSAHSQKKAPIAFVRGRTGLSDYLLLYLILDKEVKVAADIQVQDQTVTVVDSSHAADGQPHRVVLERQGSHITLKVDESVTEVEIEGGISVSHDPPALLDVGWVRKDNFRFTEFSNFTGDIWNVFFTSDALGVINARPLEVYHGYDDGNHGVTTTGVLAPTSQSIIGINSGYMYGDGASEVWGNGQKHKDDFPAWNPGRARTVYLVDPNSEEEDEGASPAVAFIVCGIALVFFLGLTAFLVVRHRRRHRKSITINADGQVDEEEGLLNKPSNATEEEYRYITPAKLRQGPKKGKTTDRDPDEDENEETPMLQKEAPMAETAPPGQEGIPLETFKQPSSDGTRSEEPSLWWDSSYNDQILAESDLLTSPIEEGPQDSSPPPVPPKNLDIPPRGAANNDARAVSPQSSGEAPSPKELDTTVPVMPEGTYDIETSVTSTEPSLDVPVAPPATDPHPPPKPPRLSADMSLEVPEEGPQAGDAKSDAAPQEQVPAKPDDTTAQDSGISVADSSEVGESQGASSNISQGSSPAPGEETPPLPPPQNGTVPDDKSSSASGGSVKAADDSEDDSQKDIQITAEVYKEPPTSTEQTDGVPVTANGSDVKVAGIKEQGNNIQQDADEIKEVGVEEGTSVDNSPKVGSGGNKGGKKKSRKVKR